jgi:hypothetical protein
MGSKTKISETGKTGSWQPAPAIVHNALNTPGKSLDKNTRSFMESKFGHDFSQVKVHTDPKAIASARVLDAAAYTVGKDIVFNDAQYDPSSAAGEKLLAHELTHVVQQSAATSNRGSLRVGQLDDVFEKEADHAAGHAKNGGNRQVASPVSSPIVQRSILGALKDIALFIPRLFGAELYSKEELQEYLKSLKDKKGPAKTLFSDNKARSCVSRENELGPYDTDTKVWLVEDMLDGYTSRADEKSIISLIRRSTDRQDIVTRIGRDRLWSNFSGGNRRIIEALTLTAADAGDALVTKFRTKPIDEIQEYASNAIDPAVKESIRRAAALANITAPVPVQANINQQNEADIEINGVNVKFLPDSIDPSLGTHAFTYADFTWDQLAPMQIIPGEENQPVGEIPPLKINVKIFTKYPSEESKSMPSKYGVGTRSEDEKTLRAHERGHGEAWIRFLRENAPPVFEGRSGMLPAAFNAAVQQYKTASENYSKRGNDFALREGDCVGTFPTDADYAGTGFTAAICHNGPK